MSIPFILLILTLVAHLACSWKLFQKAGQPAWAGFIPGYHFFVWQKVTQRPWWWILILLVPGVQFLMLVIMHVQMSRSFGQRSTTDTILSIVAPFYMLPKLAFDDKIEYTENIDWSKEPKNNRHEWSDALIFALIAAFIIRTFVFEAFTIPTPSMERSMLVGDFLFVSKARYGAKLPETPISFPLAHHTIPLIKCKSYLEWQKLDYNRLPGWADIERGDPVVFNFPEGDTVIVQAEAYSYYQFIKDQALASSGSIARYEADPDKYEREVRKRALKDRIKGVTLTVRPKDKKENYVKRCVAVAGDVFEMRDRQIYINGSPQTEFTELQHDYYLYTKEGRAISDLSFDRLKEDLELNYSNFKPGKSNPYEVALTEEQLKGIQELEYIDKVIPFHDSVPPPNGIDEYGRYRPVFPHSPSYDWTRDNFGPLTIPKAGETVQLNLENLCIYERLIDVYEENDLWVDNGQIFINGAATTSYTFRMNYYWLMGDNRHNSLDSRYWGFVPEDHVVGRPSFVWLSLDQELGWFDGKIRWGRMFRGVD